MVFTMQILICLLTSSNNIFHVQYKQILILVFIVLEVVGYKPFDDPNMVTLIIGNILFYSLKVLQRMCDVNVLMRMFDVNVLMRMCDVKLLRTSHF